MCAQGRGTRDSRAPGCPLLSVGRPGPERVGRAHTETSAKRQPAVTDIQWPRAAPCRPRDRAPRAVPGGTHLHADDGVDEEEHGDEQAHVGQGLRGHTRLQPQAVAGRGAARVS